MLSEFGGALMVLFHRAPEMEIVRDTPHEVVHNYRSVLNPQPYPVIIKSLLNFILGGPIQNYLGGSSAQDL